MTIRGSFQMKAKANLDNKDFKKTLKVSWLTKSTNNVRLCVCYMDNIISKAVLSPDDDFKKYIRKVSMVDVQMLGENNMSSIQKGDIIQIQRKGFFICDSVGDSQAQTNTGLSPLITLIYVPDGSKSLAALPAKARDLYEGKLEKSAGNSGQMPQAPAAAAAGGDSGAAQLWDEVAAQGNKIRQLKADKAEKTVVMAQVQILQALKEKYKKATGTEWNANSKPEQVQAVPAPTAGSADLDKQIRDQGMFRFDSNKGVDSRRVPRGISGRSISRSCDEQNTSRWPGSGLL